MQQLSIRLNSNTSCSLTSKLEVHANVLYAWPRKLIYPIYGLWNLWLYIWNFWVNQVICVLQLEHQTPTLYGRKYIKKSTKHMKLSSQSRAIKLLTNVNDYLRNKYIISPKLYDITHNKLKSNLSLIIQFSSLRRYVAHL